MKKKIQKVIGVLSIMKDFNMKPNFSELERVYGIDCHTIKKYYENGSILERKKLKKVSKWDPLYDVIISLAEWRLFFILKSAQYVYALTFNWL